LAIWPAFACMVNPGGSRGGRFPEPKPPDLFLGLVGHKNKSALEVGTKCFTVLIGIPLNKRGRLSNGRSRRRERNRKGGVTEWTRKKQKQQLKRMGLNSFVTEKRVTESGGGHHKTRDTVGGVQRRGTARIREERKIG